MSGPRQKAQGDIADPGRSGEDADRHRTVDAQHDVAAVVHDDMARRRPRPALPPCIWAMAPATAAMGPTPARAAAAAMRRMTCRRLRFDCQRFQRGAEARLAGDVGLDRGPGGGDRLLGQFHETLRGDHRGEGFLQAEPGAGPVLAAHFFLKTMAPRGANLVARPQSVQRSSSAVTCHSASWRKTCAGQMPRHWPQEMHSCSFQEI